MELRCRDPEAARQATQVTAKEFLFQWDGRAWKLYQVGARRTRT